MYVRDSTRSLNTILGSRKDYWQIKCKIMKRHYKDYTIVTHEVLDPIFDHGFSAETYVEKNGLKENIRVFSDFTGNVKSHKEMFNQAIKYLSL